MSAKAPGSISNEQRESHYCMQRFTQLFTELDQTNRTSEKQAALERYFREAPAADAAWALFFLTGRKLGRAVNTRRLREWAAEAATIPLWLLEECYDAAGDLAETLALVLPDPGTGSDEPLHKLVHERLLPLKELDDAGRKELLTQTWAELNGRQRFVWNKLLTGAFRIGASRTLVERAVAAVAEVPPAVMAHRLMGNWQPAADDYERLLQGDDTYDDSARPYPFCLAYPLEGEPESLGEIDEWQIEWKWDGIRAQFIHRGGEVLIWSRGEELVTGQFPELQALGENLLAGTVLDGEILAWRGDTPLPFSDLQKRLGRKRVSGKMMEKTPVIFMAYDVLEFDGKDMRDAATEQRRRLLETHFSSLAASRHFRLSTLIAAKTWEDVRVLHESSRQRRVEGMMLKRRQSPYRVGRKKGDWWKWKVEPYHLDAVLIYAQRGHGRRASLYTDYTFGIWKDDELVPIAKAYSGLTDAEIREVDRFVRQNTVERFGPVRVVRPELVFELAFEGIQPSTRHKAGIAVRFPRMARWRKDKKPADADTLETIQALLAEASALEPKQ